MVRLNLDGLFFCKQTERKSKWLRMLGCLYVDTLSCSEMKGSEQASEHAGEHVSGQSKKRGY